MSEFTRRIGWTIGETAGLVFRLLFTASVLLFLYMIAEDINAIREEIVPDEQEVLLDQHQRVLGTIKRYYIND